MKKFIIICACLMAIAFAAAYALFVHGVYLGPAHEGPAEAFVKQEGRAIYLDAGAGFELFEIRGVDLGSSIPGHFATDYAIDTETYLRWFDEIKEMGANTIRVYLLEGPAFYEAVYEYNEGNPDPLYVIQGVAVEDYDQNAHMSALDAECLDRFKRDITTMIDAIHGQRMLELGQLSGSGNYVWDISPWVIGYILGGDWQPKTVSYTNLSAADHTSYAGAYLSTTDAATPFEAMLAEVGDLAFSYETERYGTQRLISFGNTATTDPFDYTGGVELYFDKTQSVDVEHLVASDAVTSGMFASYHVYPFYPDYLRHIEAYQGATDPEGNVNTFYAYVKLLCDHHAIPVVVAEYGASTGRAEAQRDENTGRDQGKLTEAEQGAALVQSYRDMMQAGCAGSIVYEWQDEWYKRSWNTMANVDLMKAPYWSDAQTTDQSFGLLSFDPGTGCSAVYVDGDPSEWTDDDVVTTVDGRTLSMKYDEKFVYLMVRGSDVGEDTPLYLPIDTTQKSGSTTCSAPSLSFDRAADFLVVLNGRADSCVLVQERSSVFRAMCLRQATGADPYVDPPDADTSTFVPIELLLQQRSDGGAIAAGADATMVAGNAFYASFETGALRCGDANPAHEGYDSLADFCYGEDCVEIRLPWQLLNFANPSEMQIHDDYYEHWGVEFMGIDRLYVGVGDGGATIELAEEPLQGWGTNVTYHERLKESYYIMQQLWAEGASAEALLDAASPERAAAAERQQEAAAALQEAASSGDAA